MHQRRHAIGVEPRVKEIFVDASSVWKRRSAIKPNQTRVGIDASAAVELNFAAAKLFRNHRRHVDGARSAPVGSIRSAGRERIFARTDAVAIAIVPKAGPVARRGFAGVGLQISVVIAIKSVAVDGTRRFRSVDADRGAALRRARLPCGDNLGDACVKGCETRCPVAIAVANERSCVRLAGEAPVFTGQARARVEFALQHHRSGENGGHAVWRLGNHQREQLRRAHFDLVTKGSGLGIEKLRLSTQANVPHAKRCVGQARNVGDGRGNNALVGKLSRGRHRRLARRRRATGRYKDRVWRGALLQSGRDQHLHVAPVVFQVGIEARRVDLGRNNGLAGTDRNRLRFAHKDSLPSRGHAPAKAARLMERDHDFRVARKRFAEAVGSGVVDVGFRIRPQRQFLVSSLGGGHAAKQQRAPGEPDILRRH